MFSRKSGHQTWQQCKANIEGVLGTFIIDNYQAKEKKKEWKKTHWLDTRRTQSISEAKEWIET